MARLLHILTTLLAFASTRHAVGSKPQARGFMNERQSVVLTPGGHVERAERTWPPEAISDTPDSDMGDALPSAGKAPPPAAAEEVESQKKVEKATSDDARSQKEQDSEAKDEPQEDARVAISKEKTAKSTDEDADSVSKKKPEKSTTEDADSVSEESTEQKIADVLKQIADLGKGKTEKSTTEDGDSVAKKAAEKTEDAEKSTAEGAEAATETKKAESNDDPVVAKKEVEDAEQSVVAASGGGEFRQAVNGSTPTAEILIGTPPVHLKVIFDTGSDQLVAKTWLTVTAELSKVDSGLDGRIIPMDGRFYASNKSTTYLPVYKKHKKHDQFVPKRGFIQYGSGLAITQEGTDNIAIGGQTISNTSFMEISRDSLSMLHTSDAIAGVLGLQHMKDRTLGKSIFSRFRDEGKMYTFGYCRGSGDNGTFIWGDKSTEGKSVEVIGDMHWAVNMTGIRAKGGIASSRRKEKPGEMIVLAQTEESVTEGKPDIADIINKIIKRAKERAKAAKESGDKAGSTGDSTGDADSTGDDAKKTDDAAKDGTKDEATDKTEEDQDEGESKHKRKKFDLKKMSLCDGGCAAIIDTGSNIIAGPRKEILHLAKALNVQKDCSNLKDGSLPTIELHLGGVPLKVPPSAYVMKLKIPKMKFGYQDDGYGGGGGEDGLNQEQDQEQDQEVSEQEEDEGEEEEQHEEMSLEKRRKNRMGRVRVPKRDEEMSVEDFEEARAFAAFEEMSRKHGVHMLDVLGAVNDEENTLRGSSHICMPALVPLDKKTRFGALWVVGSPLMENYYTRWSYPKDDEAPKIFFEDLKTAKACQKPADPDIAVMDRAAVAEGVRVARPALVRGVQKVKKEAVLAEEDEKEPYERSFSEIRYPYWGWHAPTL